MRAIVVGNMASRRTEYFIKAGKHLGVDTCFVTYADLEMLLPTLHEAVIKLEPPLQSEVGIRRCEILCSDYRQRLQHLAGCSLREGVRFLNHPQSILQALDKVAAKQTMVAAGLRTTRMLASEVNDFEQLREWGTACPRGLFLKPRYGSGAGGIMALRYRVDTRQWIAYTTMADVEGEIVNTKRIHRLTDERAIARLVEVLLPGGAMLEEWVPKEQHEGESYDLRLVCCGNEVVHIVVRCSSGVITNLHLDNRAHPFGELSLSPSLCTELHELSLVATHALNLAYSGVDVLIARGTESPYLIEVNGQGDHIYQDLFAGNRIYTCQIENLMTPTNRQLFFYENR